VTIVSFAGVSRFYGEVLGVAGIDLSIGPGITGLVGPNGAGKSTLLGLAAALLRPDRGEVRVGGIPTTKPGGLLRLVGACPQRLAFPPWATGIGLLEEAASLAGLPRRAARRRAGAVLARVGLEEAGPRRAAGYSKGMQQRLKVARALVHDPPVLLLDEPLDGLDPVGREWMMHLMRERADAGGTVVVSTHVLHEVEAIADRVVFVADGRVVASGALGEVRETIRSEPARYRVVCGAPRELAATLVVREGTVSVGVEPGEGAVLVRTFDQDGLLAAVTRLAAAGRFGITGVAPVDRDAESVYAYVMAERGRSR